MLAVATAGHVDHGKSSLVLALTGTDPDRWAEEKRRGLTIDLGFAFTTLPGGAAVGFVDVPGHVRFLKNMLAGVGGVGAVVLVVAAPEGWMPQTEEHLRIVELLGVEHGFTVVTMADAVDEDTLETAQLEAAIRLEGTFLEAAPIVVCDSLSGRGLDAVTACLDDLARRVPAAPDHGRPRLWVDRAFSVKGSGTVVTGTLAGGHLGLDDAVAVHPAGRSSRIRGIQSGHADVTAAEPGARVALNLADLDRGVVERGAVLVGVDGWATTDVVDARLQLAPGAGLARRARLKAYVGSGEHEAVVRDLGDGWARIRLPVSLPLAPGDRILLRDPGPDVTIGAAEVLDVAPTARPADAPTRLRLPLGERILHACPVATDDDLRRLGGLDAERALALADDLVASGQARRSGRWLLSAAHADALTEAMRAAVDAHHRERPLEPGLDLSVLAKAQSAPAEVLADLGSAPADLVVEGNLVRSRDHRADPTNDPDAQAFLAAARAQPYAPPTPAEAGVKADVVRALARAGAVVEVEGTFWDAGAYRDAVTLLSARIHEQGELSVGDARDCLGSSRKHVLPLLAHLDAQGVTRRRGDVRVAGPRLVPGDGTEEELGA